MKYHNIKRKTINKHLFRHFSNIPHNNIHEGPANPKPPFNSLEPILVFHNIKSLTHIKFFNESVMKYNVKLKKAGMVIFTRAGKI